MQKTTEETSANRTTRAQPKKRGTAAAKAGSNTTGQKTPARRPRARSRQSIDLDDPALYLNRELTWLEFNRRVLDMAADDDTPLLERVKFLAIVSSNLDEFFMKRVGGLKQQIAAGIRTPSVDGRTPMEQLQESQAVVRDIHMEQNRIYRQLLDLLEEKGIRLSQVADLIEEEQQQLR